MNRKMKQVRKQIERAGGIVHIQRGAPNDVVETFFNQILNCPDCAAAIAASQSRDGGRKDH